MARFDSKDQSATWSWQADGGIGCCRVTGVYNGNTNVPASATLNSTGYFAIYGTALTAGGDDPAPTVAASGAGVTLDVTYLSDTQINVYYTVGDASSATTGWHDIGITTYAGQSPVSGADQFKVGDPTPAITGITPTSWNAGQQYACSIQIGGAGFGTNPSLTIASADGGSEIASYSICGAPSDTLITASVTTNTSFVSGSVTITVQSSGYGGSGFLPAQSGQSGSATATAYIIPGVLLAPAIKLGTNPNGTLCSTGTDVTGSTQTVLVGQQIAFTGCLPGNVPVTQVASVSWSPMSPSGTAVGGYTVAPDSSSASVVQVSSPVCGTTLDFHCDFPPFYWVDQGNIRQFTFTYTMKGGGTSPPATVTFNVTGPTNVSVAAPMGVVSVTNNPFSGKPGPWMSFGTSSTTVGIRFTVSATPPQGGAGTYSWVQLVKAIQQTFRTSSQGIQYCTDVAFSPNPTTGFTDTTPALDSQYPYATGVTTRDSPGMQLSAMQGSEFIGEQKIVTSFTMYSMWNAGLANSIPVPLGAVNWQYGCDAINTLAPQAAPNGTNWTANSPGCAVPSAAGSATFVLGTTHPTWTRVDDGSLGSCHN